jgi:hypothetical protein
MLHVVSLLAQIDPSKLDSDAPRLEVAASSVMTWLMVGVAVIGILLVTFKISKRNVVKD